MSESKFTPGPWAKDARGQLRGPGGQQVGVWDAGIAWVSRDDEADANARLIAAAPDLLAACQAVVDACTSAPPMDLIQRLGECADKCSAALAKAEGR